MISTFSPKKYKSIEEASCSYYFNAVSDTVINGYEVFGYLDTNIIRCYKFEDVDIPGVYWISAGEIIMVSENK